MELRMTVAAAVASGLAVAVAILALGWSTGPLAAVALLDRRRRERPSSPVPAALLRRRLRVEPLRLRLDRAGWRETPERFALATAAVVVTLALVGAAAGSLGDAASAAGCALVGAATGIGLSAMLLRGAIRARRDRLLAELAPTLDLVGIELSAGSSPLAALAAATRHGQGELARELRTILATTAVAADRSADARLHELGERLDLPPLVAFATILATSRDYGSGVSHGIRVLALELRRTRRRELIASSRRALSRVLVPAAVGVLLPFMAVLLYPAVVALSASFR
jgi:Flp pilus assembly protein TadB